jgi:hypothetical protein
MASFDGRRNKIGSKLAGTVALWLRKRYNLRVFEGTKKGEVHVEPGIDHCGGIGIWFALKCDTHQGNWSRALGKSRGGGQMTKTISVLTVAAFLAAYATAFAQAPAPEPVPAPVPAPEMTAPPAAQAPAQAPGMGEEKKADKPAKKSKSKGQGKGQAKKTSKKHGLDRADEAAGQHGKQGRDKARSNQ